MSLNRRLLFMRTDRLGDVCLSLPSLAYLREAAPEMGIDFVCRPEFIPLLQGFFGGAEY